MWCTTDCISHIYQLRNSSVNKHSLSICFVQELMLDLLNLFFWFWNLMNFRTYVLTIWRTDFSTSVMFWEKLISAFKSQLTPPLRRYSWPLPENRSLESPSVRMMTFYWYLLHSQKLCIWVKRRLRLRDQRIWRGHFLKLYSKRGSPHETVQLLYCFFFNCSGFCHTLTWISHGFTCVPHPDPPSHLPLHPIPLGLPSAPGPRACLMHPTWAGDLFHPR